MVFRAFTIILFVGLLSQCERAEPPGPAPAPQRATPLVLTSFYPVQYFAQRIAGPHLEVVCPLPADADPIFWQPPAEEIVAFQGADLVVLNGAHFEKWVDKVTLSERKIVSSAAPLEGELIRYENAVKHTHGKDGEHSHEGIDGHTWVDPNNAELQAAQIRDAFAKQLPEQAEAFAENYEALAADLDALDASLKVLPTPPVLCSHPAYNYVARRYDWNIQNLDLDPETMPDAATIAKIRSLLQTHPAKVLLWESAPTDAIAAKLNSELGLESVVFSPCEQVPEDGDYLSVMRTNIERLAAATQ